MPQVTKNLRDGELVVKDGAGTPASITLALDEGDLRITEYEDTIKVLDRGTLSHERMGDERPVEFSFTAKYVELMKQTGASDPTLYEALRKIGGASGWTSTQTDGGDVYTVTMVFTITSPTGGEENETITLSLAHAEQIEFSEGDEYNTVSVTGTAFMANLKSALAKV